MIFANAEVLYPPKGLYAKDKLLVILLLVQGTLREQSLVTKLRQ